MAKFSIHWGIPDMEALWEDLLARREEGTLKGEDAQLLKKLAKAVVLLADNPRHPGLNSHEIDDLSRRHGEPVWQSYLENRTPAAGRLFWRYGPGRGVITVLGVEPHPESSKRKGYSSVKLSRPKEEGRAAEVPARRKKR